jgi:hypothetical protein
VATAVLRSTAKGSLVLYIDDDKIVVDDFVDERYTIIVYPRPPQNPASCSSAITFPLALMIVTVGKINVTNRVKVTYSNQRWIRLFRIPHWFSNTAPHYLPHLGHQTLAS